MFWVLGVVRIIHLHFAYFSPILEGVKNCEIWPRFLTQSSSKQTGFE